MHASLYVRRGPSSGQLFPLSPTGLTLIGRNTTNHIVLLDRHVSANHCVLRPKRSAEGFVLIDARSRRGTLVNGRPLSKGIVVPGDILRIGPFELELTPEPATRPPAPARPAAGRPALFELAPRGWLKKGATLPPGSATVIGRASCCHVVVDDEIASGCHCLIALDPTDDGCMPFVIDLRSSNGTHIDRRPIHRKHLLPGEVLMVGQAQFKLRRARETQTELPEPEVDIPPAEPRKEAGTTKVLRPKAVIAPPERPAAEPVIPLPPESIWQAPVQEEPAPEPPPQPLPEAPAEAVREHLITEEDLVLVGDLDEGVEAELRPVEPARIEPEPQVPWLEPRPLEPAPSGPEPPLPEREPERLEPTAAEPEPQGAEPAEPPPLAGELAGLEEVGALEEPPARPPIPVEEPPQEAAPTYPEEPVPLSEQELAPAPEPEPLPPSPPEPVVLPAPLPAESASDAALAPPAQPAAGSAPLGLEDTRAVEVVTPRAPGFAAKAAPRLLEAAPDDYDEFFGFHQPPFRLTLDADCFYDSQRHWDALDTLVRWLKTGPPLAALFGDPGCGKSLVVECLARRLTYRRPVPVVVRTPLADARLDALVAAAVARADQLYEGLPAGAEGPLAAWQGLVKELRRRNVLVAFLLDDAHTLPGDLLRRAADLLESEDARTVVRLLLAGDEGLRELVATPPLAYHFGVSCYLAPLELDEVAGYVAHRLFEASGREEPLFTRRALELVAESSGGVPRLVNVVADAALLRAFREGCRQVSHDLVEQALRDALGDEPDPA